MQLHERYFNFICKKNTSASEVFILEEIQSLWSGYGQILRLGLQGYSEETLVLKHVCYPKGGKHPRGWNTDISHQRKVKSYEVEKYWYEHYNDRFGEALKIPKCIATHTQGEESFILMEDLDACGYSERKAEISTVELKNCIAWLARFHAIFLGEKPEGLWEEGTYWHLRTRPDELRQLRDNKLKMAAVVIDKKLKDCQFQTIVHGDAKLANFCFSKNNRVSMVDFQYVGGGCGMKDLAYFLGSCLSEEECERQEQKWLNHYFTELRKQLKLSDKNIEVDRLEEEWKSLYHVAWADFHRFLKGWSPGHWKLNDYSERITKKVIEVLGE